MIQESNGEAYASLPLKVKAIRILWKYLDLAHNLEIPWCFQWLVYKFEFHFWRLACTKLSECRLQVCVESRLSSVCRSYKSWELRKQFYWAQLDKFWFLNYLSEPTNTSLNGILWFEVLKTQNFIERRLRWVRMPSSIFVVLNHPRKQEPLHYT